MANSTALSLATSWQPGRDGASSVYALTLTNGGTTPLENFRLGVSGYSRFDAAATIDGATLERRLSNHLLLAPPAGFVLAPGATWTISIRNPTRPLRHWSDGASAAYILFADGRTIDVQATPTVSLGDNSPPRKGAVRMPVPARAPVPVSIIPWPRKVAISGTRGAPQGLALAPVGDDATAAAKSFTALTAALFPVEAIVRPASEGGMPVHIRSKAGFAPEAYALSFAEDAVTIEATTRTGLVYGLITLGQLLRGAIQHPHTFVFPSGGTITDEPGLVWRGAMLDVSRQFYTAAEVSQFVRILAWNKMNRFHWHLSDDEGWRVEIDAYPALTAIGAWRGQGEALPPLYGTGAHRSGGYYTKAVIREIVALGESLGIVTVPEIDIPGHCFAVLQSLPELRDPGEEGEYQSVGGFPNNCLNPAHEPVYTFVETVIDEVLELFPSGIFHVGADEVPLAAWSGSPLALAMLERLGGKAAAERHAALKNSLGNLHGADAIEGSGTAILQAEFLRRVQAHITSKGAITGGWEEAAHGNVIDKTRSYLVGWRNVEVSAELAKQGYDIVVSPGPRYYLDIAQGTDWSEPGAAWAGGPTPQQTYEFEAREGWSAEQLKHFLGVQACIWSEPLIDRAVFDRLVFPRISAIAEAGWTEPGNKSWARFSALCGLMPILYGHWAAE